MARSNMVENKTDEPMKLTQESILQSLATSLNNQEFSTAVATSLNSLQVRMGCKSYCSCNLTIRYFTIIPKYEYTNNFHYSYILTMNFKAPVLCTLT